MRKSHWTPSIVPTDDDQTVYLVADDFGKLGRAWRQADYDATDLETVIQDLGPGSSALQPEGMSSKVVAGSELQ